MFPFNSIYAYLTCDHDVIKQITCLRREKVEVDGNDLRIVFIALTQCYWDRSRKKESQVTKE